jgi:hypothetical protein
MEAKAKPRCKLTGTDGNVFALAGKVYATLVKAGQQTQADEMKTRLFKCKSYDESLQLFLEYVDVR